MEPRRRVLRPAAVVNAIVLVGVFIVFFSSVVFTLGSKSGAVFQPDYRMKPAPGPAPPSAKPHEVPKPANAPTDQQPAPPGQ